MRLFIAIELPASGKQALSRLRTEIPGARWVPQDQLHLTLAFLGEVEQTTRKQLGAALRRIELPAFSLRFGALGCFPDRRRPRVLWAGLEPEPLLLRLAARVRETVIACGISQEERPFAAHITLARCKLPAAREVNAFFRQHSQLALPPLTVAEFILFESRLTPQGALHLPLEHLALH